jgi:hypothetical protein
MLNDDMSSVFFVFLYFTCALFIVLYHLGLCDVLFL